MLKRKRAQKTSDRGFLFEIVRSYFDRETKKKINRKTIRFGLKFTS